MGGSLRTWKTDMSTAGFNANDLKLNRVIRLDFREWVSSSPLSFSGLVCEPPSKVSTSLLEPSLLSGLSSDRVRGQLVFGWSVALVCNLAWVFWLFCSSGWFLPPSSSLVKIVRRLFFCAFLFLSNWHRTAIPMTRKQQAKAAIRAATQPVRSIIGATLAATEVVFVVLEIYGSVEFLWLDVFRQVVSS